MEAWDVSQGEQWWEGLNQVLQGEVLVNTAQKLFEMELEKFPVRLKAPEGDLGRGLVATRGLREGETN